jgi:hypothetical protein
VNEVLRRCKKIQSKSGLGAGNINTAQLIVGKRKQQQSVNTKTEADNVEYKRIRTIVRRET